MKKIIFGVLCLFFFWLFGILGVWQLHRYHFKQHLLANYQTRLTAEPIAFSDLEQLKDLTFQPVKVKGSYLSANTMLVQNQFYNHHLGFEVLTPFQIPGDNKLLLIDRGWVSPDHLQIKDLAVDSRWHHLEEIIGHVKLLNEYQFILGKNILQPQRHPIVMQRIDIDELSRVTGLQFYPYIIRLNADEPGGFVREWTITNVIPERHLGYAVQWFAMALALFIGYFSFYLKNRSDKKRDEKHAG